jgi:hypothetical protein
MKNIDDQEVIGLKQRKVKELPSHLMFQGHVLQLQVTAIHKVTSVGITKTTF